MFKNFDLERLVSSGHLDDIYTDKKSPLYEISLLIFIFASGCRPTTDKNGSLQSFPKTGTNYPALDYKIRSLAQSAFNASNCTIDDPGFFSPEITGCEIGDWAQTGLVALPGEKDVTMLQIHSMVGLWTIDEMLSIVNENGWCNQAVQLLLNAINFEQECMKVAAGLPQTADNTALLELENELHQRRKQRAKDAANARHAPINAMKQEALRLYSEREWRSKRQAAKAIIEKVQAFGLKHFSHHLSFDRAQQTVYEWIIQFEKRRSKI